MKYFIDTEFIEGFHQPKFLGIPIGKKRHFIDLISIGIVCEDGRTYYAVSNEFNPNDADQWVKDNVISKLGNRYKYYEQYGGFGYDDYISEIDTWKSNKQVCSEIIAFVMPELYKFENDKVIHTGVITPTIFPEFYGYYSDYDWVLFCSLFGRMIDLPNGFPMYCRDLKQMIDEYCEEITRGARISDPKCPPVTHESVKNNNPFYPQQTNEHNALADAKWNFELYKFLQTI